MSERSFIFIPLLDGRWLCLDKAAFEVALIAGAELAKPPSPTQDRSENALVTSDFLGQLTSVPASWFEEAARRNQIPSVMLGKYRRFNVPEVLRCLDRRPSEQDFATAQLGPSFARPPSMIEGRGEQIIKSARARR